jgi:DNA-binding PadR family transcriptional regulator
MRGSIVIEKILEILQGGAEASIGLLDAMASSYAESYKKLRRGAYGWRPHGESWAETFRDRQRFYSLLGYLKKHGLVEAKKENKKSLWNITKKGRGKLELLKERNRFSKASAVYPKSQTSASLKIIAYDIPAEGNQKRRDWLRWALLNMGFTMLQKSVWVGKNKIPEEFLKDLRERQLLPHVQIFEVSKRGTLKEIV